MKKCVVAIGGGNGTAITLRALKFYQNQIKISAVVSVSDSGGSSGMLRSTYKVLPPGDILRAILGLSSYEYKVLRQIFYENRITVLSKFNSNSKEDRGPNLGNLFLTLLAREDGDYIRAIRAFEEILKCVGQVYPSTLESNDLCVELNDGTRIKGEAKIDRPDFNRSKKIARAWIEPEVSAYSEALEQITGADYVILGPGSLYTSIIPNLLVKGLSEALKKTKARLIYIVGKGYELKGETGPERLSGFVNTLRKYLPRDLDAVIYHQDEKLSAVEQEHYHKKSWAPVALDPENVKGTKKLIPADIMDEQGAGSPEKLGQVLNGVIAEYHFGCNSQN